MPRQAVDILVVLSSYVVEHVPAIALAQHLRSGGVNAGFVTQLHRSAELIRREGFLAECIAGKGAPEDGLSDPASWEAMERRYRLLSLRDLCLPEIRLTGVSDPERVYERAVRYAAHFEEICDRWRPSVMLQNPGGELIRRTAFAVARRRSLPHVFIRPTPFRGRISFSLCSELGEWTDDSFSAMDTRDAATIAQAREFSTSFRREKVQVARLNKPGIELERVKMIPRLLRWKLFGRDETMGPMEPLWRTRQYCLAMARTAALSSYRQEPDLEERYVFYPLHVWHDSAITVRAPHFLRQEFVIMTISDALPEGYRLYVKEHPAAVGRSPFTAMRRISRLANVTLINPETTAHELVEHAACVVVINSTAGFEALAYHKPVVVLGRPFYSGRGVTHDVSDLFELRAAIARALATPLNPDRADLLIWAAFSSTRPGSTITANGDPSALAESVVDYVKDLPDEMPWRY